MSDLQAKNSPTRSVVSLIEGEHDSPTVAKLTGDRFVTTAQAAITSLQLPTESLRFSDQFEELLSELDSWITARLDRLSRAFICISSEGIALMIVQKGILADFALEDELVDLDISIANDPRFDLIPFNTLLVPGVNPQVLSMFFPAARF